MRGMASTSWDVSEPKEQAMSSLVTGGSIQGSRPPVMGWEGTWLWMLKGPSRDPGQGPSLPHARVVNGGVRGPSHAHWVVEVPCGYHRSEQT